MTVKRKAYKMFYLFMCVVIVFCITGCTSYNVNQSENQSAYETSAQLTVRTTQTTQSVEHNMYVYVNDLGLVDKHIYTYGKVDTKLSDDLNAILQKYNNSISIACWSTDGSKAILYNTQQTYFSACTIKMPVMYAYCKQIDAGIIDANKPLTYNARHYYNGSGEIRYQAYGTKYSTKYLIEKSISISDNVAYVMLLEAYGKDPLKQLANQLGCESIVFSDNSKWSKNINARDLMVVWSEIYNYFCSTSETAKMLKNACTNTGFNYGARRIIKYDYSHKSGDNFGEFRAYHDAGIIWSDVPYIYVVLTQSEGTQYDVATVDAAMEIVKEIMTKVADE